MISNKFTGQVRDRLVDGSASGPDYFGARYMSGAQGRFTSTDPLMASASVADPQSWNRYTYARNNPLRYNDPLGLFPSSAYNCSDTQSNCLNDDQRRILENSNVNVGKQTVSGEKLWNALGNEKNGEAIQNAFVNVTDRLGSISLAGGGTALGAVSSVSSLEPDRIKANVSESIFSSISGSKGFQEVSGSLHPGFDFKSFKSRDNAGNIQFSFGPPGTAGGRPTTVDIDHDLYQDWRHAFEVIQNHATGGKTSQDAVRELLLRRPEVGITPSTDPKWNRK